jgi:integrase
LGIDAGPKVFSLNLRTRLPWVSVVQRWNTRPKLCQRTDDRFFHPALKAPQSGVTGVQHSGRNLPGQDRSKVVVRNRNPVRQVKIPSDREAIRTTVLTDEQERAYFAEAQKVVDKAGRRNLYDVGRLMINQGFRPEEITRARKEQFNEKARTFTVVAAKTKAAGRTVDLTEESFQILKPRNETSGPWLFPSERYAGQPITKLNNSHDRACRGAHVSFVLYDLRHTFGTRMATEEKIDPFTLAAIMGHANLRTIMRYVHTQQQEKKRAMEKYESAMKRKQLRKVIG